MHLNVIILDYLSLKVILIVSINLNLKIKIKFKIEGKISFQHKYIDSLSYHIRGNNSRILIIVNIIKLIHYINTLY